MTTAQEALPVTDTSRAQLGGLKHGLDPYNGVDPELARTVYTILGRMPDGSASKEQKPSPQASSQQAPASNLPYPLNVRSVFYETVDTAFNEAFSAELMAGQPDLTRQAQEVARQCIEEILSNNTLLNTSPDRMQKLQDDVRTLTLEISREALTLVQQMSPDSKGAAQQPKQKPKTNINRALHDKIMSSEAVLDFRFKHLGWAAGIDKEEKTGMVKTKPKH